MEIYRPIHLFFACIGRNGNAITQFDARRETRDVSKRRKTTRHETRGIYVMMLGFRLSALSFKLSAFGFRL